jgi:hypothetical protein
MKDLTCVQGKLLLFNMVQHGVRIRVEAYIHDLATSADTVSCQTLATTCQIRAKDGRLRVCTPLEVGTMAVGH